MGKLTKILALSGAILSGSLFLSGCPSPVIPPTQEEEIKDYTLTNISENVLGGNYQNPGGLSSYKKVSAEPKSKSFFQEKEEYSSNIKELIFTERPLLSQDLSDFVLAPRVHKNLQNGTKQILYEFGKEDVSTFSTGFFSQFILETGELSFKPQGLSLDTLLLKDGSILVSSNISDKILRIYNNGIAFEKEVYLEDDELIGITDMILGSDENVYVAQLPVISPIGDLITDGRVLRNKRVISLNYSTKEIHPEFEIPTVIRNGFFKGVNNLTYPDSLLPLHENLKIIENSPNGKIANGSDFYVSDLLERVIYKVSKDRLIDAMFNSGDPTSLEVDVNGKLYVTTCPIFSLDESLISQTKLISISSSDGKDKTLHLFLETSADYNTGFLNEVEIDGQIYLTPRGFEISSVLFEDAETWELYFTNSHSGELKVLTATKEPLPVW